VVVREFEQLVVVVSVDEARHRRVKRRTRPSRSARQTRGAQRPASQTDAKLVTHSMRRGESLAGGGWEVLWILGK